MYGTLVIFPDAVNLVAQKHVHAPQIVVYDLQVETMIAVERNIVFDIRYKRGLEKH